MLGSIGVVYGDIGTSPLYAFKESIGGRGRWRPGHARHHHRRALADPVVARPRRDGQIRAHPPARRQQGRGRHAHARGPRAAGASGKRRASCCCSASSARGLFYGDAVLTPAISVLSAVEGLKLATPALEPLRRADHAGDPDRLCSWCRAAARAGSRPSSARSCCVWFATLALTGLLHIADDPERPDGHQPDLRRCCSSSTIRASSLAVLGAVCLSVTGAEALYADLGHFGRGPIRTAWLCLVFPALVLNYFGQGALVLADPDAAENPALPARARTGRCCRWSSWPRSRPSSPARRSSPAPSR